jgi:insertion element IS1 protein InsB
MCKNCGKAQLGTYTKKAYSDIKINSWIAGMVKEGCVIRSMARLLKVSINTIIKRVKQIANSITKPLVVIKQEAVEVDELRTFVRRKQYEYWVAYALNKQSGEDHQVICIYPSGLCNQPEPVYRQRCHRAYVELFWQ